MEPETSNHISGTVTDIATKFQPGVSCVTVYLPLDFGVDSLDGLFLVNFLTGFSDFSNTNNPETVKANCIKLRLLRESPRRYEPAMLELSKSNSKKVNFRTFGPRS
jgi:hypothetical protein